MFSLLCELIAHVTFTYVLFLHFRATDVLVEIKEPDLFVNQMTGTYDTPKCLNLYRSSKQP